MTRFVIRAVLLAGVSSACSSGSGGAAATGGDGGNGGTTGSAGASGGAGAAGSAGASGGAGAGGSGGNAGAAAGRGGAGGGTAGARGYDQAVLADGPMAFWAMSAGAGSEPDLSGHGNTGSYRGGTTTLATMPNGDRAASFNGSNQYLTVPSNASLSIPTTGNLTWEAWLSPAVLEFTENSDGYVDWMGKCEEYGPTCEWEARMYGSANTSRCNRLSAYAFNPEAGLGSGAYWQADCGTIQTGAWYHIVGQYTTHSQPSGCANTAQYPGSIEIWVNGVKWRQASHNPTGCMSQYEVVPEANDSALNIGTMARDAWFQGAIGKVAIYDVLLTQTQITEHYRAMTGKAPTGSCASSCSF